MIVFLTNIVLDAFGLFADKLLLSAYEYATYANSYWRILGENDDKCAKRFDSMVKAKFTWKAIVRTAIERALGDLPLIRSIPKRTNSSPRRKKCGCTTAVATDPVQTRDENNEVETL